MFVDIHEFLVDAKQTWLAAVAELPDAEEITSGLQDVTGDVPFEESLAPALDELPETAEDAAGSAQQTAHLRSAPPPSNIKEKIEPILIGSPAAISTAAITESQKAANSALAHTRHTKAGHSLFRRLGDTLCIKAYVMFPAFVVSVETPTTTMHAWFVKVAFGILAMHLALEIRERTEAVGHAHMAHHKTDDLPDAEKVLGEPVHPGHAPAKATTQGERLRKTIEGASVLTVSINNLPWQQQATIMGIVVGGMTIAGYAVTYILVNLEDAGQRLKNWKPEDSFGKLVVKTGIPKRIGVFFEDITPYTFHKIPEVILGLAFVACGKVMGHAIDPLENLVEFVAKSPDYVVAAMETYGKVGHLTVPPEPFVESLAKSPLFEVSNIFLRMVAWGGIARVAIALVHVAHKPAEKIIRSVKDTSAIQQAHAITSDFKCVATNLAIGICPPYHMSGFSGAGAYVASRLLHRAALALA